MASSKNQKCPSDFIRKMRCGVLVFLGWTKTAKNDLSCTNKGLGMIELRAELSSRYPELRFLVFGSERHHAELSCFVD